jgi:transposase
LGWKQEAIADAFGLTQGWISRTLTKYDQQGQAALLYRKAKGASPRLTNEQVAQLVKELNKGPQHHGFPGEIWTRKRVKAVIEKFFNVSYNSTQMGRIFEESRLESSEASKEGSSAKCRSRPGMARRAPVGAKKKPNRRSE